MKKANYRITLYNYTTIVIQSSSLGDFRPNLGTVGFTRSRFAPSERCFDMISDVLVGDPRGLLETWFEIGSYW